MNTPHNYVLSDVEAMEVSSYEGLVIDLSEYM